MRIAFALAAIATLSAPAAWAGSLEVGPIRVIMIGPERTATLNVRNTGDAPIRVQVRTVDWAQPDGQDSYTPSNALLASPPLMTIGPSESQVIRLVVEKTPAAKHERSYRLILDELPPAKTEGGAGVQTAIRVLVPVFITPSTVSRPRLTWKATATGDAVLLTAQNEGDARDRLVGLKVSASGQPLAAAPLEGYVLSRSQRAWTLPATSASSLSVEGAGEFGPIRINVPIAR